MTIKVSHDGPNKRILYEGEDGTTCWYLNGHLHKEDGPAIEYADGTNSWYLNGKLHREDGPAVEYADGPKLWWVNGVEYTEEEFMNYSNRQ